MTQANEPELFEVGEPTILIFVGTSIGSDLSTVSLNDVYASVSGWWPGAFRTRAANGELILARNSTRIVWRVPGKAMGAQPIRRAAEMGIQGRARGVICPTAVLREGNPAGIQGTESRPIPALG